MFPLMSRLKFHSRGRCRVFQQLGENEVVGRKAGFGNRRAEI
jgi:hypothetical protein